jgi:hypothetical protein
MTKRWVIVVLAACLVITAAALAYAAGKAKAVPVQDVVRAKRFEVVDSRGHVRVEFGTTVQEDGTEDACLNLYSGGGRLMARLVTGQEGSSARGSRSALYLYSRRDGAAGTDTACLEAGPTMQLRLTDADSGDSVLYPVHLAFGAGKQIEDSSLASMAAREARYRLSLGLEGGWPTLQFMDGGGEYRTIMDLGPDGSPSLEFRDRKGTARAVLGTAGLRTVRTGSTERTAESSLVLFDKDGKVLWRAP